MSDFGDADISFGMGLQNRREALGMSRDDAAERIGVSNEAVRLWETGKSAPRVRMLPVIAKAYGCKVSDLMSGLDVTDDDVPDDELSAARMSDDLLLSLQALRNRVEQEFHGFGKDSMRYRDIRVYLDSIGLQLRSVEELLLTQYCAAFDAECPTCPVIDPAEYDERLYHLRESASYRMGYGDLALHMVFGDAFPST